MHTCVIYIYIYIYIYIHILVLVHVYDVYDISADPSSAGGARPEAATEADSTLVSVVLGLQAHSKPFFCRSWTRRFIAALQTEAENWCT